MGKPKLTLQDYQKAALRLNVDEATIRAVVLIESGGSGFLSDGRVVIRFEPHIFSRYTKGRFDKTSPEVSYPAWKPGNPKSVAHSYELFNQAAKLSVNAAVMSTSWGSPQIMGFQALACGCETLTEFVAKMERSEADQLDLFVEFILSMGLDDEMRRKDWASLARQYNGAGYRQNRYDEKLAAAYRKFSGK